jgi:hypothetical protein
MQLRAEAKVDTMVRHGLDELRADAPPLLSAPSHRLMRRDIHRWR